MLERSFNIDGVLNCSLQYLTDPSIIQEIVDNKIGDVLLAKCRPLKKIDFNQAINYPFAQIKLVLDQLRKIEEKYPLFYSHFDIDYNNYHIGPTIGNPGIVLSFELRPKIKIKDISRGGFINENE